MTDATFEKVKAALTTAIHSARDAEAAAAAQSALDALCADREAVGGTEAGVVTGAVAGATAPEPPAHHATKVHPKK
jgi:hypothetical protein